jgi:phage terminase large subunit-like protein
MIWTLNRSKISYTPPLTITTKIRRAENQGDTTTTIYNFSKCFDDKRIFIRCFKHVNSKTILELYNLPKLWNFYIKENVVK